ncbi:MAG: hypothetical protein HQ582_32525 [Planctomycetes bacterium]|nr:hypothetical protein [Planctomycetota bacterium]
MMLNAMNGAQTGALAGFEGFRAIAQVNLFVGLLSLPAVIGGAYWGGIQGAMWGIVLSMAANWILNHRALRREAARAHVPLRLAGCLRDWPILWRFSLPAALSGMLFGPVNWACGAMLVNQPNGYAEMGLFSAAVQWKLAILLVPGTLSTVALPILSSLSGNSDRAEYRRALKYNLLLNGGIALALAIPIALLSPLIMRAYGKDFQSGGSVLVALALAAVLASVNSVVGQALASKGRMWLAAFCNLLWAVALLVTAYWAMSIAWGAVGLALAEVAAYLLLCAWQSWLAVRGI